MCVPLCVCVCCTLSHVFWQPGDLPLHRNILLYWWSNKHVGWWVWEGDVWKYISSHTYLTYWETNKHRSNISGLPTAALININTHYTAHFSWSGWKILSISLHGWFSGLCTDLNNQKNIFFSEELTLYIQDAGQTFPIRKVEKLKSNLSKVWMQLVSMTPGNFVWISKTHQCLLTKL